VVVVGLVLGSTVLGLGGASDADPGTAPSAAATTSGGAGPSVGAARTEPAPLLTDASMLSAAAARQIEADRTWKVALTQRGLDEESPQAACLDDPDEGQPAARQNVLRLLSSTGKGAPGVLHQATAYGSAEEAAEAYAVTAKTLGGCAMTGAYIDAGARIRGLGESAVGQTVRVVDGKTTRFHSVVLTRTGTVLNVLDVAQPGAPSPVREVAGAAASVVDAQCELAGGKCAGKVSVSEAPPPAGGDQPGFLTPGDLPPVSTSAGAWAGDPPEAPQKDFTGSQCETVTWAEVPAERRAQRTYVPDRGAASFGVDQIVLTRSDAAAAASLVRRVRDDLASCEDRQLTASVSGLTALKGRGAGRTEIDGWAATVGQKTDRETARYRVGIVAAGPKVVFTFANPQPGLDFSDQQWRQITVRAGQRATQVR